MGMVVAPYQFAGSGIDSSPHRYWRIKVTAQNLASTAGYIAANEIEMKTVSGGTDQCTGGTALEDSHFGSNTASLAFDDNTGSSSWWACNGTGNNAYIGYDFGAGNEKNIIEVTYRNRDSSGDWQVPTAVTIDYSDTSSTGPWTVKWSVTGISFVLTQTKTWTSP